MTEITKLKCHPERWILGKKQQFPVKTTQNEIKIIYNKARHGYYHPLYKQTNQNKQIKTITDQKQLTLGHTREGKRLGGCHPPQGFSEFFS